MEEWGGERVYGSRGGHVEGRGEEGPGSQLKAVVENQAK